MHTEFEAPTDLQMPEPRNVHRDVRCASRHEEAAWCQYWFTTAQGIRESAIICDYLDDSTADFPLKPTSVASRARMLEMPEEQRSSHWKNRRVLDRVMRQVSCVELGVD